MKKKLVVGFILFFLGFFTHSVFFPNILVPGTSTLLSKAQHTQTQQPTPEFSQSTTYITYKSSVFTPSRVVSKKGNRIIITNNSATELMWLQSTNPQLSTQRGYGKSERLNIILTDSGEFAVTNKLNPKSLLVIKVKP